MFFNFKRILLWVVLLQCFGIFGQVVPEKKDSLAMYRNIENYSKRSKFTKFMHKLIFEPIAKQKIKKNNFQKKIAKKNYVPYECRIIRNITIVTLDPFGNSELDSTQHPKRFLDKAGNALHSKTRKMAIRNILLFKKNTPLDSLLVQETERLIRSQRYVRSVAIESHQVGKSSDSVDVTIRVLDSWSLIPDFSTTPTISTFKLTEKNFLGFGHEFSNTYRKSLTTSQDAFSSSYTIPNILQKFIKSTISYQVDVDRNYTKYINLERPFFSVYAHWAGGIYLDQQFRREIPANPAIVPQIQTFKFNTQDYWAGNSFRIFKGNSEESRVSNLITSVRYVSRSYMERPSFSYDSLRIFSDEKNYLASIGVSSRKFTKDRDLFNFNVTEDVDSGLIYNLTGGYQYKNQLGRFYFGARFAEGKYFKFGYLSANIEYGTFFNKTITEQSAVNLSMVYFTNLIEIGQWKFRQFVKPQFTVGFKRLNTNADRLSLNGDFGIPGFNAPSLFGTKKLLIHFQTQGYSPWNVIGFRLNPYLSCSLGMLSGDDSSFKNSRIYSQVGAGIIVSNDYLVFSSFQFSFSFYPAIPGVGDGIIKTNSFKTYDFGLQNFEMPKPSMISYR